MCACEPRECCACACTTDLLFLPAEEEEGDLPVNAHVLFASNIRAVEGSKLPVAV